MSVSCSTYAITTHLPGWWCEGLALYKLKVWSRIGGDPTDVRCTRPMHASMHACGNPSFLATDELDDFYRLPFFSLFDRRCTSNIWPNRVETLMHLLRPSSGFWIKSSCMTASQAFVFVLMANKWLGKCFHFSLFDFGIPYVRTLTSYTGMEWGRWFYGKFLNRKDINVCHAHSKQKNQQIISLRSIFGNRQILIASHRIIELKQHAHNTLIIIIIINLQFIFIARTKNQFYFQWEDSM